jgi:hypothetical protein
MKKAGLTILALLACGITALGSMDDKLFTVAVTGTATNTASYVLRGELEAVHVDIPTAATGTVTVTTSETTLFTKASITADAVYYPRVAVHTTAGAAATFNAYSGATSNIVNTANAQAWYGKPVMAGVVTVTVIGQSAGAKTYNVKLIYKR